MWHLAQISKGLSLKKFCKQQMKVKSEQNHRPTQAREMGFVTWAVSLTCAVFSHQCSSVYLDIQKLCEAGQQISSSLLNLYLY